MKEARDPAVAQTRGYHHDDLPIVPTARRTFVRTEQVSAFARVYLGGTRSDEVTVVTRVVNRDGAVVRSDTRTFGADQFGAARSADYRLDLPPAGLEAGDYLLSIQASSGKNDQRRNVRFSVR